jgi:hypothetical protein
MGALRDSQNYPIQSSSSDLMMTALNYMRKQLKIEKMKSYAWASIHDAAENDIYPGELLRYMYMLKYAMEDHVQALYEWLCVPMSAEFELGVRWDGAMVVKKFDDDHMILKGRRGFYDETMDHLSRAYKFDVTVKKELHIATHKGCGSAGEVDYSTMTCAACKKVVPREELDFGETLILRKSYEGESGGESEVTAEIVWRENLLKVS